MSDHPVVTDHGEHPDHAARWEMRPRTRTTDEGAPVAADVLLDELSRIQRRVDAVIAQGRDAFVEGSESYDRATVAVLRLAALFEEEKRFSEFLSVVTAEERRGITTTRDIAAHRGYGAMNAAVSWRTVTELLPDLLARIRAAIRP
ncbi:antitoxin [Brachybacterium tyrofermentans]|uniref:Antitoxin n=1 Tax=Brachybacterium tyrofermentans TaxID=47848 RepID=A0ABW0FJ49_9MICO